MVALPVSASICSWTQGSWAVTAMPETTPRTVPSRPIRVPSIAKIRSMLASAAPIALRIAMSPDFPPPRHLLRTVVVGGPHLDSVHHVSHAAKILGGGEIHVGEDLVVLEEARLEDSGDSEALEARPRPERGRGSAEGRDDDDRGAHPNAQPRGELASDHHAGIPLAPVGRGARGEILERALGAGPQVFAQGGHRAHPLGGGSA